MTRRRRCSERVERGRRQHLRVCCANERGKRQGQKCQPGEDVLRHLNSMGRVFSFQSRSRRPASKGIQPQRAQSYAEWFLSNYVVSVVTTSPGYDARISYTPPALASNVRSPAAVIDLTSCP